MNTLVGDCLAVAIDVISQDLAVRLAARFDDIEDRFVGREAEPVRAENVVGDNARFAGLAIDSVDRRWHLRVRLMALVITENSEDRIGEPD